MSRRNIIIAVILGVVAIAIGAWAYNAVLGEAESASEPISAATLAAETAAATPGAATEAPSAALTAASDQPQATGAMVYQISQDESTVSFNIYELLRGADKDVIGTSNQVAGEFSVDLSDLSSVQAGEIRVNARTLATDDDKRNNAIRNRILFTDQYEYITFKPTQITGLSGSAQPGQSFSFQIAGDLTIKDITQPVVFDVTVQVESANRLSGSASTTIQLSDFELVVPDVPFVANVADEIKLEINFVLLVP
jgi:polyisoprenoid-binding protein YceI